jgi:hypothetical protein
VVVYTVNGQPLRAYLHHPNGPVRWLVGEVDGHQAVWTPDRRRSSCTRHPHPPGRCRCVQQLARLADPAALDAWYRALGWRQRRHLHTTALTITDPPARPGRDRPVWTWGLGRRLLLAALLLWLLLLLLPLLRSR